MPRPSQSPPITLNSVVESSFVTGYVIAEDEDDEEAHARTFFVTIEPDGLSIHTCQTPEVLIADSKSLDLALELLSLNKSNHLSMKERTEKSRAAIKNAKEVACTVKMIDREGIQEFIEDPPISETGNETSDFHKFAPSEWMKLIRAGTAIAGQLTWAGTSTEGRVRNTSGIAGARSTLPVRRPETTRLSARSIGSMAAPSGNKVTASVAASVWGTDTSQSSRQAGVEVVMEDAGLGTLVFGSPATIAGGDPMDIDDSDVEMTGV
jgi:hypothetical protein